MPEATEAKEPTETAKPVDGKKKEPSATQTDLQALQGSGRGKVALLAGVLVVALGAAGWTLLNDGGSGNPESPGKVMLVTTDGGQETFLVKLGFEADAQTFENLESKAKQEVPDLEDNGVLAIVALADRFGFGYVAFERPHNFDFSKLETESGAPSISDGDRWLVVSVGDLADPHVVTGGYGLLSTLFEQERLAELLPPKQPATVEALQLRDQLREGIDHLTEMPVIPPRRFAPRGGF